MVYLFIFMVNSCHKQHTAISIAIFQVMLLINGIHTMLGTHSFAVAGPVVWNSLPANIRSASISLQTVAGMLKTICLNCLEHN